MRNLCKVSLSLALVGLLALPGYKTSYNDRRYLPADASVNVAYTAAERHFSQARLNPELLMIEADHDMRNPSTCSSWTGWPKLSSTSRVSPECRP